MQIGEDLIMLNTYFKIGDFICHVDCYDRETG